MLDVSRSLLSSVAKCCNKQADSREGEAQREQNTKLNEGPLEGQIERVFSKLWISRLHCSMMASLPWTDKALKRPKLLSTASFIDGQEYAAKSGKTFGLVGA